jgi:hypothetical protein
VSRPAASDLVHILKASEGRFLWVRRRNERNLFGDPPVELQTAARRDWLDRGDIIRGNRNSYLMRTVRSIAGRLRDSRPANRRFSADFQPTGGRGQTRCFLYLFFCLRFQRCAFFRGLRCEAQAILKSSAGKQLGSSATSYLHWASGYVTSSADLCSSTPSSPHPPPCLARVSPLHSLLPRSPPLPTSTKSSERHAHSTTSDASRLERRLPAAWCWTIAASLSHSLFFFCLGSDPPVLDRNRDREI